MLRGLRGQLSHALRFLYFWSRVRPEKLTTLLSGPFRALSDARKTSSVFSFFRGLFRTVASLFRRSLRRTQQPEGDETSG
jgi:hypothetical protein